MWWFVVSIVALIVLWQTVPRVIQFCLDIKGRRVFYATSCPACGVTYEPSAVRRAKHLVKTKVFGGPPPAPFSAMAYEAWELRCTECEHVEDFDPQANVIVIEEPTQAEEDGN